MAIQDKISSWLEDRWVTPAYAGWVLIGLAIFFFGAATNTLAGWLYVISGLLIALLLISAVIPRRSLRHLQLTRAPIYPVHANEPLNVTLTLKNPTASNVTLIQIQDALPATLSAPTQTALEHVPAYSNHQWTYNLSTQHRGLYRWTTAYLRTAAPFGLFWGRRPVALPAQVMIYPQIIPLTQCPLIDGMGQKGNWQLQRTSTVQPDTSGITRTLRTYRWGDPTRFIHWRTSARYGELQVRELEQFAIQPMLTICLDNTPQWQPLLFEQAVTVAASLFIYATKQGFSTQVWTADQGLCRSKIQVLETLATTQPEATAKRQPPSENTILWLTNSNVTLTRLLKPSRWILWPPTEQSRPSNVASSCGLTINSNASLQQQIQQHLPIHSNS